MADIPKHILDSIFQGESETLEFKSDVRDPGVLARLISAFANTSGGSILIGVSEPPEIVGINVGRIKTVFENALSQLEPRDKVFVTLEILDASNGSQIASVVVKKSETLILAQGTPFVRTGESTRPMKWLQMLQMMQKPPLSVQSNPPPQPNASLVTLAKAVEKQSENIERQSELLEKQSEKLESLLTENTNLRNELQQVTSSKEKWKERVISFLLGVVASVVAAMLYKQ